MDARDGANVVFSEKIRERVAAARDLVVDALTSELVPRFPVRLSRGETAVAVGLCVTAVAPRLGADGVVYAVPEISVVEGMLPAAKMSWAAEFLAAVEEVAVNLHSPVLESGEYIIVPRENWDEVYLPEEAAAKAAAGFAAVLAAEEQHRNWAQSQGKEVPAWLAEAGVLAHLGRELCEIHKPPPPPQDSGGEAPPSG